MIGKNNGVYMSGDEQRSIERDHEIFSAAALKIKFMQELIDALKSEETETARRNILDLLAKEL